MSVLVDITKNELESFAKDFLRSLPSNSKATILALSGDLGAGKTTFTQIIARMLGVEGVVQSPTFVVMKRYDTKHDNFNTLIHIDAYRLKSGSDLGVLGFHEWKEKPNTLIVIEWPEQVSDVVIPNHHLLFSHTNSNDIREVKRII